MASSSTASSSSSSSSSSIPQSRPLYAPPPTSSSSAALPFDENDPRIYFDKQSTTWKYEAIIEQEVELEWNSERRAWLPVLDEDLLRTQQTAYNVEGVDEGIPAGPIVRTKQKKRQRSPSPNTKQRRRINTSVYISGLPLDCTKDEIAKVFSRYGVLNEDDEGKPRIKMYTDDKTDMFKGEALVTYFKQESVELAINVLDESCLRASEGKSTPIMRVMQAEFDNEDKQKKEKYVEQNLKPPPNPDRADKKRAQKRYAKMNDKLLDWDSDSEHEREELVVKQNATKIESLTTERQVCLRRMFTLAELEEDPTLLLDLKEDVREECESLGKVTNVVLWDKEPEGILTVKFAEHSSAVACVEKMDGRFFGGRQIIAHLLPGKARFKMSGREIDEDDEDDEQENEEKRRQDAFGDWLENQE